MEKNNTVTAYKGFDKNLQCRGFQYEVGGEYTTDRAKACETGFHCCENPLDVLGHYAPIGEDDGTSNRFCEVEAGGDTFHSRANGETRPNSLADFLDFNGLLLTPRATDGMRANFTMESLRNHNKPNAERSNLSEQIAHKVGGGTSRLNPLFVQEMMGFPADWLVLPFLGGERKP